MSKVDGLLVEDLLLYWRLWLIITTITTQIVVDNAAFYEITKTKYSIIFSGFEPYFSIRSKVGSKLLIGQQ